MVFGPDIQHIQGHENIIADAMSRMPTTTTDQREHHTSVQDLMDKSMSTINGEFHVFQEEDIFPLDYSLVQQEQEKELKTKIPNYYNY